MTCVDDVRHACTQYEGVNTTKQTEVPEVDGGDDYSPGTPKYPVFSMNQRYARTCP